MKINPKITLYFDSSLAKIDPFMFKGDKQLLFREKYRDKKEESPPQTPRAHGRIFEITPFVDSSHATNKVTRHYHTG